MPIEFRLPAHLTQDTAITHVVPSRYRKLRLPIHDTAAAFVSGKWGVLLKQQVHVAESFYAELYIEPTADLSITVVVSQPVIIMQAIVTGNTRMIHPGSHIQLQAGKMGLQYLSPDVEYTIKLTAGQTFRSIYFQTPVTLLDELADTYQQLKEMLRAINTDSSFSTHLPYIRLSASVRMEIEKMKNCPLTGQARTQYYKDRKSVV